MQRNVNFIEDACKSDRSRQELSKQVAIPMSIYYLLANIGFDTAKNEPLKVCQKAFRRLHVDILS